MGTVAVAQCDRSGAYLYGFSGFGVGRGATVCPCGVDTGGSCAAPDAVTLTNLSSRLRTIELPSYAEIVLAPLSDDWDSIEFFRRKKWLGIAARFPEMPSGMPIRSRTGRGTEAWDMVAG